MFRRIKGAKYSQKATILAPAGVSAWMLTFVRKLQLLCALTILGSRRNRWNLLWIVWNRRDLVFNHHWQGIVGIMHPSSCFVELIWPESAGLC